MHAVVLEGVLCALCDVGSVTGSACMQEALLWKRKSFPGLKYGCIFLPINIWNFFLESIFLYALFCDLKSVPFVVKFQMRMCITSRS